MNKLYCKHYLLPNKSLLNNNLFKTFVSNLKYEYFFIKDHICLDIRDSIHYKILTKEVDFDLYNLYITITKQTEHSVDKYKKLINNFDIHKMQPIKIYMYNNNYFISDGCHRLAIIYFNNYHEKVKYLLISN